MEVEIRDKKTGKVLRQDYVADVPRFFGIFNLTPADIIKLSGFLVAGVLFFVNGKITQDVMQATLAKLTVTTDRLINFKENSDAWDAQVYGTRFIDGEPSDKSFKIKNRGAI